MIINDLRTIVNQQNNAATVYFKLKDGDVKLADIDNDNALPNILELYIQAINSEVIDKEGLEIINLSSADDRNNVIYKYNFEIDREPFVSIARVAENHEIENFSFVDDGLDSIDAIIVKVGNAQNAIYIFSKFYSINLLKRGRIVLIKSNSRFNECNEELLQISGKIDFIYSGDIFYINNLKTLERNYGFEEVIRERASQDFATLKSKALLYKTEGFEKYIGNKVSTSRKFVKIMDSSKVIESEISLEKLADFVSKHPVLKNELEVHPDEKKFNLKNKKQYDLFLKILDDDFLKSELTEEEYDAIVKNSAVKAVQES